MNATVSHLLSPRAIREAAARIYKLAEKGESHFKVHPEKLGEVSEFVLQVTRENYPDLKIPFHSRWGHFKAGGVERVSRLEAKVSDKAERARSKLDLAVVSVLLDAGSGPAWRYRPGGTEGTREYSRSEGLAVASFDLFMEGAFSAKGALLADAAGLEVLTSDRLAAGFQVSVSNPLVGLDGRLSLLHALGRALNDNTKLFPGARPGGLYDWAAARKSVPAAELLGAVLEGMGSIWPGRTTFEGVPLGDVWPHSRLGSAGAPESLVPFHKLSQWMTYSLIEPLEEAGVAVSGVDELTGLAEYRNGGLMLDRGLIELRDPSEAEKFHPPASELVIEWRALTVYFLDRIADRIRKDLGRTPESMPLARILEGGTWWAGRKAAQAQRADGSPPLKIESDGTVF